VEYTYNVNMQETIRKYGNQASVVTGYDSAGRIVYKRELVGTSDKFAEAYMYDNLGRRLYIYIFRSRRSVFFLSQWDNTSCSDK